MNARTMSDEELREIAKTIAYRFGYSLEGGGSDAYLPARKCLFLGANDTPAAQVGSEIEALLDEVIELRQQVAKSRNSVLSDVLEAVRLEVERNDKSNEP